MSFTNFSFITKKTKKSDKRQTSRLRDKRNTASEITRPKKDTQKRRQELHAVVDDDLSTAAVKTLHFAPNPS